MLILVSVQWFLPKRSYILKVRIIFFYYSQNLGMEMCAHGEDRESYFYFFSSLERISFN